LQAENVSKVSSGQGIGAKTLEVPAEVGTAARVLVRHFDPEELYEAMVKEAGRE
jgi:hypothetical protein